MFTDTNSGNHLIQAQFTLAVVADDLTGGNAVGNQFVQYGFRVKTLIGIEGLKRVLEEKKGPQEVLVVSTETRDVPLDVARKIVKNAVEQLRDAGIKLIFKQNDSTLNGHIGEELWACANTFGQELVLYSPACPTYERVTIGGYHFQNGSIIRKNGVYRLVDLLNQQVSVPVHHVPIEVTEGGAVGIREFLQNQTGIAVFDALNEVHLSALAMNAIDMGMSVIAGSVGLARALAEILSDRNKSTVIVAGSYQPQTIQQVTTAAEDSRFSLVSIPIVEILQEYQNSSEFVQDLAKKVIHCLDNNLNPILTSSISESYVSSIMNTAQRLEISPERLSSLIIEIIQGILRIVLDSHWKKIHSLALTGGHTSRQIIGDTLKATELSILGEAFPAGTHVRIEDGRYAGVHVITKSGKWGEKDAFIKCIEYLHKNI